MKTSYDLGGDIDYMKEYIDDAYEVSKSDNLLESYDKEWALKDQEMREGYELGKNDSLIETVKKMKDENLDIYTISKCTGLDVEKIQKI